MTTKVFSCVFAALRWHKICWADTWVLFLSYCHGFVSYSVQKRQRLNARPLLKLSDIIFSGIMQLNDCPIHILCVQWEWRALGFQSVYIYNLWCRARKSWLYCCQVLDHVHNNGNLFMCINLFHFILSNEVSVLTLLFLLEDLTLECLLWRYSTERLSAGTWTTVQGLIYIDKDVW